ncbi:hypothetical protein [Sinorhizobium medicae]|nr:hypothetical protein [Sinorhizobium medicae]MDX0931264.1 hypothetical protein [Sinorhizobium medicae]
MDGGEERVNGFQFLRSPENDGRKQRFWDDLWIADMLAVLFTGTWRTFSNADQLEPWLRLLRLLLDPRPLVAVIDAAPFAMPCRTISWSICWACARA